MQPLYRNDVFRFKGARYRVVHIDNAAGKTYVYPVDDSRAFPVPWETRDLVLLQSQKALKLVLGPTHARPLASSAAALKIAEVRWATVSQLIDEHIGDLMERESRGRAIAEHAKKVKASDRHILNLLRKLWQRGLNKYSLLSDHHNCGRITLKTRDAVPINIKAITGKEQVVLAPSRLKSRGRRPIHRDYIPFSYPPGMKAKIAAEARALYLKDSTVSIRFVQDVIQGEFFALRNENGDIVRDDDNKVLMLPFGERATNEQLRYLLKKAIPEHEAFSKRVSAETFNNDVARSDGSVHDDNVGPGDVYEIDATIVDVLLVSRFHSAVCIGKATLYLVVDRNTNLIVGFHLCLNKPSWEGAKNAILSISSDWEELCKSLGVKYREKDWPARNTFPNRFFTDRGEGISEKSDVVVLGPGIEVTTAPRAAPRRKCRVEGNFFYTIGVFLKDLAGGYEPPQNRTKRLAKKYDKDMRYSLDHLASLILKAIIRHNNMVRTFTGVEPGLVYEDFKATPINLWNHRVANSTGLLSRTSFDEMRQKLLPLDTGRVRQNGICFRDVYYRFEDQRFAVLCALAARGAKLELVVQYDPSLADHIWVSEKNNPQVQYYATLTSNFRHLQGARWAEVIDLQEKEKGKKREDDVYNQSLRIGYAVEVSMLDDKLGREAKAASKGVPRATALRLGVEARKLEEMERAAQHLVSQTSSTVAVQGLRPLAVEVALDEDDAIEVGADEIAHPKAASKVPPKAGSKATLKTTSLPKTGDEATLDSPELDELSDGAFSTATGEPPSSIANGLADDYANLISVLETGAPSS